MREALRGFLVVVWKLYGFIVPDFLRHVKPSDHREASRRMIALGGLGFGLGLLFKRRDPFPSESLLFLWRCPEIFHRTEEGDVAQVGMKVNQDYTHVCIVANIPIVNVAKESQIHLALLILKQIKHLKSKI